MVRALVLAALAAGLMAVPGVVAQPAKEEKAEPRTTGQIVAVLHNERVAYEKDLVTTPFPEVLGDLSRRFAIPFIIDKTAFEDGNAFDDARAIQLGAPRLEGLTLHSFLQAYLRALSVPHVTYMVRDGYIEITSLDAAQKEAGLEEALDEAGNLDDPVAVVKNRARLKLPLVCVVVEDRPLSDLLGTLARVYGLNIVIDPAASEQAKTRLTERLLNVPADTAIELLAKQAGLNALRKGNVFRVTPEGEGF